ncbi:hypothetical protein [Arcticibacterium luteifluviistationis]|uniref:DUF5074 domain-containing protein n=1 Tax=Arcticibacterium luteifluviistationis TaxID=1784714 RepID=A0A2Z4GG60_9BACT|nr:hypothetical protein [Arcticibacterium luteifluviistationis]AWW00036.1 hypothetical protein DJ013_18420 [Arcticibacterium luteifluviistationis]
MKKTLYHFLLLFSTTVFILSCDDHNHDVDPEEEEKEYKYLRILVSDETDNTLSLIKPYDGTVSDHTAKFANSALYVTESGRFAGIVHRDNNLTETFDTGFENHGDHVDVKGTPKFGAMVGESESPTHFKSKRGELMTFNDGDATLSVGNESDIHTVGIKMKTINVGLIKHHGAMATFSNGNYAITEKDNSISGSLPERVKVIDSNGQTVHASTLATAGIHGNATDGTYAIFGSSSGILVVQSNGDQKLIDHPEDFGTAWFGTILETATPGEFVGYTSAKGAYLIDVVANTVKPILENTEIMQCKVSYNASKIGILLYSGEFKLFDLSTLSLVKEGGIIAATETASTQKPQMVLAEKFVYVTQPESGEVIQILLSNLSNKASFKVGDSPYGIAIIGHESSADH